MHAVASGLGVMAPMSMAGSSDRWASAPTTTPGSAKFLLMSRYASDCPVARASASSGTRFASVS